MEAKEVIELFAACLTPTIAIMGIYLAVKNYSLAKRKRKDDLFDRRYKFLKDFEKLWKTTGLESEGATKMMLDWDDIEPFAQEAYFLFGKDISNHLESYAGKSHNSKMTWVPDSDLAKPFHKYLCFEMQ